MHLLRRLMFAKRFFSSTSPSFTEPEIKYNLKEFLRDYEARTNRNQDVIKESLQESQKSLEESLQESQKSLKESLQESQKSLKESLQESQKSLKESLEASQVHLKQDIKVCVFLYNLNKLDKDNLKFYIYKEYS
jgi:hypothetical protein